ncbi:hypothetical protein [Phytohabitans maris]|uniref:hypothetical protein n=1 Tax=Phytohabitans maris TaxID=3071409 RepID=UPI003D181B4F
MDRPHTSRRVNAICASRPIAGWQQVKISRNRSSSSPSSGPGPGSSATSRGIARRTVDSRRSTSRARW